jgi:hypothetical protein
MSFPGKNSVASFIVQRKTQPECSSPDAQINKRWHIHTMEYYSVLKRKGTLMLVTREMHLEDIVISEMRQAHRTNIIEAHLDTYEVPRRGKFIKTEVE